jgi:hypothetical protein
MTSVTFSLVMSSALRIHSSIVLVSCGSSEHVVAEKARLRDRLAARWRARGLDCALAEGISPETSAPLALRAHRLTEPDRRWSIAGTLRRIVREAQNDRRPSLGRITPVASLVRAASQELNELADTLDDPGPVAAHGVAQALLLLTDGTGPLYNPRSSEPLSVRAAQAARQLRPWAA